METQTGQIAETVRERKMTSNASARTLFGVVIVLSLSLALLAARQYALNGVDGFSIVNLQTIFEQFTVIQPKASPEQMMFNPLAADFSLEKATEILRCTTAGRYHPRGRPKPLNNLPSEEKICPDYFRFIQKDFAPWKETGITHEMVEGSKKFAAFKVIIVGGKLYIDYVYECFQSRSAATFWGILLLLEKYGTRIPNVEFYFSCEDRPRIRNDQWASKGPPVLFAFNKNSAHYDILFPDWSFWGWPELIIAPWDTEREKIVKGSIQKDWLDKIPMVFWSGNPYSGAPHRRELQKCHHADKTEIQARNWGAEIGNGKPNSKLEDQCTHMYMIYTEGNGWSVSLKYIMSCGSPTFIISPGYYEFFSRGMKPWEHFIPVRPATLTAPKLCDALDKGVEFSEKNESVVRKIGKAGQNYMRNEIGMENVYNYMYHLLLEYSSLLKYEVTVPDEKRFITMDHFLCLADRVRFREAFLQAYRELPPNKDPCIVPEKGYAGGDPDWEVQGRTDM